MSEKSKGDTSSSSTSRIVNNPLLSANVTNLTYDDFQMKPVILPAAPPIIHAVPEEVSASINSTKRIVTVGQTPNIDTDTLSEINLNPIEDDQSFNQDQKQYRQFQHQQQTEFNDNAFPQIQHEPRSINNNEIADDSILSQAASSFSQLPSVASTVFSTFSKVINNYSPGSGTATVPSTERTSPNNREQSSSERELNVYNSGYQPQEENFPSGGFNNQSQTSSSVTSPEPPKLYTPPLSGSNIIQVKNSALPPPLTAGGNTYRLTAKKKTYAQIPGLSVNQPAQAVTNFQPIPSQEINLPPNPVASIHEASVQPVNSFLDETNQTAQSISILSDNYSADPFQQQTKSPPKSEQTNSSSVGGLFSGVTGVIQNLSGLVKTTVTSESIQNNQPEIVDPYFNRETSFSQGFTAPPPAFSDSAINTTSIYNQTVGHQIGFEPIQSSFPQSNPLPPIKPPTAPSSGSSFRLQKGTRLYKSPFEQTNSSIGITPPYPIQNSQQQAGLIPPLPKAINQGFDLTENLAAIPAPENFQNNLSPQISRPTASNFINPIQQVPPVPSVIQKSSPSQQVFLQPSQVESFKLGQEQQNLVSQIQQATEANQYFQSPTEFTPPSSLNSVAKQSLEPSIQFFSPQVLTQNQDNVNFSNLIEQPRNQIEIGRPPSANKQEQNQLSGFNSQRQNFNINQNKSNEQSNFFDSVATRDSISQLEKTNLGSSSTPSSFLSFPNYIQNNNPPSFSVPVEGTIPQKEALVQKVNELSLNQDQSFGSTVCPPPKNLPPTIGQVSVNSANPFRRDSTKSHPTVSTNFFIPKDTNPAAQEIRSVEQPTTSEYTSASQNVNSENNVTNALSVSSITQSSVPSKGSTADFFNPVTSDEWVQQVIKEANPNITETSILTTEQAQTKPTLDSSEVFPERFDFSTLLSGENTNFKYLPPAIKPKSRTQSVNSETNFPPPIEFRQPVPLPTVNGQPQIGPEASVAAFYNPTPSHEWAQQLIEAAKQGLNEIPLQDTRDNSKTLEGTIEPEEDFPEQFDFSSVLPPEGPVYRYLPPPVNDKLSTANTSESEQLTSAENVKILKITKETLPEGTPSCVGEFLTEASLQSQTTNTREQQVQKQDIVNNNQESEQANLSNYFGQSQNTVPNSVHTNLFQDIQPQTNFLDINQSTSIESTIPKTSTNSLVQQQLNQPPPSVDKNLNCNVLEKTSTETSVNQNLLSNFFQSQTQQQSLTQKHLNQNELFQINNQQQSLQNQHKQNQLQPQYQQQQPISAVSFFDQFNNNNSNLNSQTNQPSQATAGQITKEEDQRIQNFFNNPPPQNLVNNSVNELNFKNLYGCGGVRETQITNSEFNTTPGKNSDYRSTTPASNIVEPPSSACSEFSSDYLNSSQNSNQAIEYNSNLSDPLLDEIPDELISDYIKMSNSNQAVACNVVYTQAKKHWFYKRIELNKQIWTPFSHKDSDALEESFLKKDRNIVPVEGGRHDVDISERTRVPIYWKGEPTEVRRCSWFYKSVDSKYVPYQEDTAEFLENEYREASNSGVWRKKVALANGETVVFHAPTVLVHFLQSQTSDAWGGATSTIKPRIVKRDLDDFSIEDGETDKVDHLLFIVHGIGSACDLKFRKVEEVVDEFRSIAYQLVQAHYKNSVDIGDVGRVEVLPVSWHSELHSAECGIDEQLKAITLESIPKLRNFSNDTIVDALFYTSPVYCQYIINTVANCMNRVFLKFCQRNTNFSGQVSLAGHSLGSLIMFDLLVHQKPVEENETNSETLDQYLEIGKVPSLAHSQQVNYTFAKMGAGQPTIEYPQLLFAPKKFFAMGSPIGLFVTVRGIGNLGLDFKFPTCPGFFNIFHPYDPIAYRIEALINPELSSVRPVLIPHHKGRKRMHLELKETMTRVGTEVKQRIAEIFKGTMETVFFLSSKNKVEDQQEMEKEVDKVIDIQLKMEQPIRTASSSTSDLQSVEDFTELNMNVGKLNESKRIDYVLQEAPLEFFNEYLFALTSHVCYWDSEDTILFMVKEIYSSLGITTDATVPQQNMTIERPSSRNTPTSSPSTPQKLNKNS